MSNAEASIQKRLAEYKANPIQPLELASIKENFQSEDCSVNSFKKIYRRDPIFCYTLISEANKATQQKVSSPFAADHAMSTLGLSAAAGIFKNSKVPNTRPPMEVRFSLATSLLAAELANNLCQMHRACTQAYWTSLCYLFPETMLWHLAPKEMWRIYYRQLTNPKQMGEYEKSLLGFNLYRWRIAVAKELQLSEQNQILFEKRLPNKPKELLLYARDGFDETKTPSLKDWDRYEGWLIVMANKLARSILLPWHNNSYRHTFHLIHQLAGCDTNKLRKSIQDAVRTASINFQGSRLPNPGANFIMLKTKPAFPGWLLSKPKAQVAKRPVRAKPQKAQPVKTAAQMKAGEKPVASPALDNKPKPPINSKVISPTAIKNAIQKIVAEPDSFETSSDLIQFTLRTLIDELKLDRVSFMVVDYSASKVVCRAALNAKNRTAIKPEFEFKQPTPLIKFIERQTFMLLSRKAHQNIWAKLPIAVQKDQVSQFVLCSLKPGKRVNALVYADTDDVSVLSPQRLGIIKKMLLGLNKALADRNAKRAEKGPAKKAQAR
ncbi:hypothetical protein FLL45_08070 [Aliikangiella marina]|uniref:HDOD domain-containing protein n=1 Tax=Aliikangiella marina TaxID=1712262 RepID=A0A545TCG0_9GAMM|nr:hypothetical protein [Aliikangiella marina]TQV74908.1 hypothetical protein FLL45_08070 [Aliikangiella marina]